MEKVEQEGEERVRCGQTLGMERSRCSRRGIELEVKIGQRVPVQV